MHSAAISVRFSKMKRDAAASQIPPLRALQAFEALGRCGSVTAGAADLRLSPSAVSQQLRKLEAVLGVTLAERQGTCLQLTVSGKLYFNEIKSAFDTLRRAQAVVSRAKVRDALVVSCLPSIASKWLGRHIFDWQAVRPGARVRLIGTDTEPSLGSDPVDFRISYGERARAFDHWTELFTDFVVPVCSPELLRDRKVKTPGDLLLLPLLSIDWDPEHRPPPDWAAWAAHMGSSFASTRSSLLFSLSSAAIDAAVEGRGCVMAQLAMIGDELAAGRLAIPFDHRLPLPEPYVLVWDREALRKPFAPAFRAWVVALGRRQAILSRGEGQSGLIGAASANQQSGVDGALDVGQPSQMRMMRTSRS
jgi:LysR family transcriptional regulator, glycine cleavage system transcriptional activator